MGVVAVLAEVVAVITVLLFVSLWVVVGPDTLRDATRDITDRARMAAKPIGLLAGALLVNSAARDIGVNISWLIGINITQVIYRVEGSVVATIQSSTPVWLTGYFGYVYVYGYTFLLVFPLLAGLVASERQILRRTAVAYTINYILGILCYLLFVAYGPRNYMPALVEPLLFDALPRFQLLTSEVNANTNVFPSLHTSLSVTVALLAVHTHDRFPKWTPIATFLAASIVLSTMVLGIHWATDVVAGTVLGVFSVWVVYSDRLRVFFSSEYWSSTRW